MVKISAVMAYRDKTRGTIPRVVLFVGRKIG